MGWFSKKTYTPEELAAAQAEFDEQWLKLNNSIDKFVTVIKTQREEKVKQRLSIKLKNKSYAVLTGDNVSDLELQVKVAQDLGFQVQGGVQRNFLSCSQAIVKSQIV